LPSTRALSLGVIALTLALAYGVWYAYSVVLVALLQEFGWSRSVLAGAFSVFTLVHGAVNPVIGTLCDRLRPLGLMAAGGVALGLALWADSYIAAPWQLYLFFGVFTAIAVAAAGWIPAIVQVQRDFQDKLGLAIGIVSSGVGVGMLLVVPLTQLLIDAYGWRTAFRVLAAVCVLWIVPSSLFILRRKPTPRHAPQLMGTARNSPSSTATLGEAVRGAPFWLMLAAFFFGNICSQTMHVHQVAYLVDLGVSAIVAASVVGVVGLSSIAGKIGGGWLSDRFERELVYVGGITIMVAAMAGARCARRSARAVGDLRLRGAARRRLLGHRVADPGDGERPLRRPALRHDRRRRPDGQRRGQRSGPVDGGVPLRSQRKLHGRVRGGCGVRRRGWCRGWHARRLRVRG
jgi:MFS family permease